MYVARDYDGYIFLYAERPQLLNGVWSSDRLLMLNVTDFPEVTFEDSPSEVEIIEKSTLDAVYEGLDQYENFLGLVACMRRAQKEANDMIAQVECYEEAREHVKKAEELESMVDKWLEGEAL